MERSRWSDSQWRDHDFHSVSDARDGESVGDTMLAWNYADEEMLGRKVYRNGAFGRCVGAPSPHLVIQVIDH